MTPGGPQETTAGRSIEALLARSPEDCVFLRRRCPACDAEEARTLVERAYDSPEMLAVRQHEDFRKRPYLLPLMAAFPYQVVQCRRCQLVWQPVAPRPEIEQELYSGGATGYRPGKRTRKWSLPSQKASYYLGLGQRAQMIFALSPERPPEEIDVLDFGAGWGEFLNAARALGHHCWAAEIDRTKRRHLERLGFECLDLPSPRRFDFIHSDQVFEHLCDPLTHLRSLRRQLASNGHLLVVVPVLSDRQLRRSLPALESGAVRKAFPFLHLNLFSPRAFAALAARAGLAPVRQPPVHGTVVPGPTSSRLRATARRTLANLFPLAPRFFSGAQLFRAAPEPR